MFKKFCFLLFLSVLFLPIFVSADAPPPPGFEVNFTYEGQSIDDEKFYAVVLQCRQEKIYGIAVIPQLDIDQPDQNKDCSWSPRDSASNGFCTNSSCYFDWLLGQFKLAVYMPSLDKTFISEIINREYLGHYGSETQKIYDINLLEDGGITVSSTISIGEPLTHDYFGPVSWLLLVGVVVTIILESIVALMFVLLKKVSKRIFLALLAGNIISVPFVWTVTLAAYSFPWVLCITEIIAVAFEAWIIKLFVKDRLSWKMCLSISLIMNIVSFLVGPYLLVLSGNI